MKYIIAILLALSCVACKKEADNAAPANNSTTNTTDTPAAPVTFLYTGSYRSIEIFDDPQWYYIQDTAFIDTMQVSFFDSSRVRCKLYTYTIFHSRNNPGAASSAGRDSLEFSSVIGSSWTRLDTLLLPVRGGAIRFSSNRDSVYFDRQYSSGVLYYLHNSSFLGKKQ